MTDETPSTAVATRDEHSPPLATAPSVPGMMSPDEIQAAYRVAAALASSGLYKDVKSAEQAFGKMVVGRALGLNEAQSLSLYAMEGKIEVPYPLLANFVRSREGYAYEVYWIKSETGKAYPDDQRPPDGERQAVRASEDDPADLRPVVGCSLAFTAPDGPRGVSTWTIEDTLRAQLDKDRGNAKSNHVKYPRNMFLARAMSNGIKWYVSEVLGGLPIYAEGEIERTPNLADGSGDGSDPGWGDVPIAAVHEIEKLLRRAERVGHAGLASRGAAQMTLQGQSADAIRAWINAAHAELNAMESQRAHTQVERGEVPVEDPTGDEAMAGEVEPEDAEHLTPVAEGGTKVVDADVAPDPDPPSADLRPESATLAGDQGVDHGTQLELAEARLAGARNEAEEREALEALAKLRGEG